MPHSSRLSPLEKMVFASDQLKDLWITILRNGDSFNTTRNINLLGKFSLVDNSGEKPANWLASLTAGPFWPLKYMAIRIFRRNPVPFISESIVKMRFLSSGTTSGPEGRSKSPFSTDGVNLYRGVSMLAFSDMLKKISGHDDFCGVSLVPTVGVWPDSSLARMIHWIGELWPLRYANYTDIHDIRSSIAEFAIQNKPVFIFGTAFHLIDFLDDHKGQKVLLPPGSVVIETGGTKGRTRSVSRPELYDLIADGFGISESQIVSEYGMCELASQAYDFVPHGKTISLLDRRFQFPWWAKVRVMSEPHIAEEVGEGALLVWDQARTDVAVPIQIEDFVKLDENGGFTLIERIPTAPLKGCSLKVDEIVAKPNIISQKQKAVPQIAIDHHEVLISAKRVCDWLNDVSQDSVFAKRLAIELGSEVLARQALEDFKHGLPKNSEGLAQAVKNALDGKTALPASWLVIPASSHSFAAIHLLAVLLACNVDILLRLSSISHQDVQGSSLERLFELIKSHGFKISALPGTWKLTHFDQIGRRAVAVFGDDRTIENIRAISPSSTVVGFGTAISGTLVKAEDLDRPDVLELLIRDNTALSQRGCMSARINLIIGKISDNTQKNISDAFADALADLRKPSKLEHTARSLEIIRQLEQGANVVRGPLHRELIAQFKEDAVFENVISKQEMSFIFQTFNDEESPALHKVLAQLKRVSFCENTKILRALSRHTFDHVNLGSINAPKLDGTLFAIPLLRDR